MLPIGEWAARRHEIDGLSWAEIAAEAQEDERWAADAPVNGKWWNKVRDKGRAYINGHKQEFPGKPGVTVQNKGNIATIYYRGPNITTPPELLDYIGYDPAEWICVDRKVRTYQGQSKREESDLVFDEGRISGTVEKGGVIVVTMFGVYVKLVRRHPVPIQPVITPVQSGIVYRAPVQGRRPGLLREAVFPDPHYGFWKRIRDAHLDPMHDRRALDVAHQIAIAAGVDGVTFLGDDLDMAEWTSVFTKRPEFQWATQPALLESHWHKAQLRMVLPEARMRLLGGNHDEKRLSEAMLNHLPAAYGLQGAGEYVMDAPELLSLPHLLGLDSLGIEYIGGYPDAAVWLNERVALEHGDNSRLQVGDYVTICGHYHRREWVSKTRWGATGPVAAESFCPGMLGRLDRLPGKKQRQNWQQGFALVDYDPTGTAYQITPVPIEDGRAIWNGQLFEGRDCVEELRAVYPGWNW